MWHLLFRTSHALFSKACLPSCFTHAWLEARRLASSGLLSHFAISDVKPTLGEEDCFFVASCSTLQLHMTTMRRPVHAENDFRQAVEVIAILQNEEVRAKLSDPKPRTIAYDMHFDVC